MIIFLMVVFYLCIMRLSYNHGLINNSIRLLIKSEELYETNPEASKILYELAEENRKAIINDWFLGWLYRGLKGADTP